MTGGRRRAVSNVERAGGSLDLVGSLVLVALGSWWALESWWALDLGGSLDLGGPFDLGGGGHPRSETHYLGRVSRLFLLLKLVHGVN